MLNTVIEYYGSSIVREETKLFTVLLFWETF